MEYPDVKAIVSGYFKPLDETRCPVCGAEVGIFGFQTCGDKCFRKMCEIQREWPLERINQLIDSARRNSDPRFED